MRVHDVVFQASSLLFPHLLQEILPVQISWGICQTNTTCAGGMMDDLLSKLLAAPEISHPSGSCLGGGSLLSLSYLHFPTFAIVITHSSKVTAIPTRLWVSALHSLSRLYHSLPNFTTARRKIAHFTRLCTPPPFMVGHTYGTPSGKKYGIIWEFFPNVRTPPFGNRSFIKNWVILWTF